MAMTINTNLFSLNAQRNTSATQNNLATSMQRLSSGLRVNSAKDDAAGLAIAERMNAQVRGMNVASRNANDGISLAQTAEGALGKVSDAIQRMRELAVQSANGTNNEDDRANLDAEYQQLASEVDRIIGGAKFNGTQLLDGSAAEFVFQVGAGGVDTAETDTITVESVDMGDLVGAWGAITGEDASLANTAIEALDAALTTVTTGRATMGAIQNRFDSVIANLATSAENLSAARGRIMDADFAAETMNLSRAQILQQAGTAMISQANQLPQQVLSLLR
ncbi:MAG: flagellin [Rhizobacter sp.]